MSPSDVKGVFDLSSWGVVSIRGMDAVDYVQRMSTLDTRGQAVGDVAHGAFLTGKAGVVALGLFRRLDDGYLFLVPPGQASKAAAHIEKFHFAERLEVADVSDQWGIAGLWNVKGPGWVDDVRPALTWVTMEKAKLPAYLASLGVPLLDYRLFEYFRIDAAIPQAGVELADNVIVLEGNFDRAVARNKGCYPGQEVVERIFTYGQVNRKLLPLTLESSGAFPKPPFALRAGDVEVGTVASLAEVPDRPGHAVGLAFLRRSHWDYRDVLTADGGVTAKLR